MRDERAGRHLLIVCDRLQRDRFGLLIVEVSRITVVNDEPKMLIVASQSRVPQTETNPAGACRRVPLQKDQPWDVLPPLAVHVDLPIITKP